MGQRYSNQDNLWSGLDARREVVNEELPVRTLKNSPLKAYLQARQSGRYYQPQYEENLPDQDKIGSYLTQGRWFRQGRGNGHFCLGGSVYYIGNRFIGKMLEIRFDDTSMSLTCQPEGSQKVVYLPTKRG